MGIRFRSDYVQFECKDGSTKAVFRRVEDIPRAFELVASNWTVKVNAGLKLAVDAIEISPSVEIKKELIRLHDRIGEVDQNARTMFTTAYVHYRSDPCNNQAFFDQAISNIPIRTLALGAGNGKLSFFSRKPHMTASVALANILLDYRQSQTVSIYYKY